MNRPVIRFGLISAGILVGLTALVLLLFGIPDEEDYALGEVIGYTSIVISLIPIFFAIKYYRDREGSVGFWKGVGIGAGVAIWPSVVFGVYNLIYMEWIDPGFLEKYTRYSTEQARARMSAEEFQQFVQQMELQQAIFSNPWFQAGVMFLTVFLIGLVIALASSLILQRRPKKVAV